MERGQRRRGLVARGPRTANGHGSVARSPGRRGRGTGRGAQPARAGRPTGKEPFLRGLGANAVMQYGDEAAGWEEEVDLALDAGRARASGALDRENLGKVVLVT